MADNTNGSPEAQAADPPTPAQEVPACSSSVLSQDTEPDCSILEESEGVSTPPPEEDAPSPSPSPTPDSEETPQENGSSAVDKKKDKKKTKKAKEIEQTIKQTMQTLNAMDNPDEKLAAIVKRYAELLGDHRSLQREFKAGQRMQAQTMREKEKLQAEHSKALLARSKLESLCRELQRHNKAIKEESQRKMKEEEEKRREISSKFQTTLGEITTQMDDNQSRSLKMKEENMELCQKLKSLVEQYEKREEHVEKLIKHKDLEKQLAEAKMQQATMLLAEEKEKYLTEKQELLKENYAHRERSEQMAIQEENMKMQLKLYTEKFEELHKTLNQSNEVFNKFKIEMDTMNKRMKKLEKESFQWRTKWEKSNVTLLAMAEEKQTRDKELIMMRTKCGKLENLCRALQNARGETEGGADRVSEVLNKFEEAEKSLAAKPKEPCKQSPKSKPHGKKDETKQQQDGKQQDSKQQQDGKQQQDSKQPEQQEDTEKTAQAEKRPSDMPLPTNNPPQQQQQQTPPPSPPLLPEQPLPEQQPDPPTEQTQQTTSLQESPQPSPNPPQPQNSDQS